MISLQLIKINEIKKVHIKVRTSNELVLELNEQTTVVNGTGGLENVLPNSYLEVAD